MAKSLHSKEALINFKSPVEGPVLDVGAGGGELSLSLKKSHQGTVYSLDASPEAIEKLEEKGLSPVLGYADNFTEILPEEVGSFSNIYASSVLHEIFSYGHKEKGLEPGTLSNLSEFFKESFKALAPGGRLLIRDGVAPKNKALPVVLELPESHKALVERFVNESPFYKALYEDTFKKDRAITFQSLLYSHLSKKLLLETDYWGAWEYLFTVNWGEKSFSREVQEFYSVMELEEMKELAERVGFKEVYSVEVTDPSYRHYITEKMPAKILNAETKEELPLPANSSIWVFEKP